MSDDNLDNLPRWADEPASSEDAAVAARTFLLIVAMAFCAGFLVGWGIM